MRTLLVGFFLLMACDSPKSLPEPHSREASDAVLDAVLRYRKLEVEGKLPTPEQEAESLRFLKAKTKKNFEELTFRIREAGWACREKEFDAAAHKACVREREPLIFSDGKERDECIMAGKTNCP